MEYIAPAKLNLSLSVTGKDKGYHLLDTIMQEIDLGDVITMEPAQDLQIFMTNGLDGAMEPAQQNNTAYTAARLFLSRIGAHSAARIEIQKSIPMQAGLGGGSSDGTTVLKGLNDMFGQLLADTEVEEMAAKVSADSAFFCRGGTQRARGFGEKLEPIESRLSFRYLLVRPDCGIDTKRAYALYDALPKMEVDTPGAVRALESGDRKAFFCCAGNALLPAALELEPKIALVGNDCMREGALFWSLTGSGSCIFAVFEDDKTLSRARAALGARYPFVREASSSQAGANRRI